MSFSAAADYLVDRRALLSKLRFWRLLAVAVFALAVIIAGFGSFGSSRLGAHIARLAITGVITGDEETIQLLHRIADSKAAAVILNIDSPGGTTEGSERLYEEVRRVAAKKPVVAVVGTMAASGAYVAALGADRIFAHGNSIVGSIGVLIEYPNISGLMDKVGVKLESIKSSPLKASPNGFEPTSDEARAAMASVVSDSFDWFKGLVRDRRGLSEEELAKVSDGRIFTGRQGLPLKLLDEVGGEREAVQWLQDKRGVSKDLKVNEWKAQSRRGGWGLLGFAASIFDIFGASELADLLKSGQLAIDGGNIDGLVSVWHFPQGN